jgi:mannitol-1-phosphate 5-dehydrogenase
MDEKSILIIGAGKIGRSFIGQLFGQSGYHVVFADIDQEIVAELNRRKSYPVVIKGIKEETILVQNVRAVSVIDRESFYKEIAKASIMAVSVGKNALEKVLPLIAEGIKLRQILTPGNPVDIIIAENMRSSGDFMFNYLKELLPADFPLNEMAGLIETSIGKMVPLMSNADKEKDLLMVYAEPYNTLILDKKAFKGPIPAVKGLSLKENIKAWVDRKAFIHNLGHATAAYLSYFYHPELKYLYEGLGKDNVLFTTRKTMLQAAKILHFYYPDDYSLADLEEHINDLLSRFRNRELRDTVFRVGQDLMRKLDIDDRFGGIIQMARVRGLEYQCIAEAMAYGLFFKVQNEHGEFNPQDELFLQTLKEKGVGETLIKFCRFNDVHDKLSDK